MRGSCRRDQRNAGSLPASSSGDGLCPGCCGSCVPEHTATSRRCETVLPPLAERTLSGLVFVILQHRATLLRPGAVPVVCSAGRASPEWSEAFPSLRMEEIVESKDVLCTTSSSATANVLSSSFSMHLLACRFLWFASIAFSCFSVFRASYGNAFPFPAPPSHSSFRPQT